MPGGDQLTNYLPLAQLHGGRERNATREMNKPSEEGKISKGGNIKSVSTAHLNSTELIVTKSNPNSAISYKHIM